MRKIAVSVLAAAILLIVFVASPLDARRLPRSNGDFGDECDEDDDCDSGFVCLSTGDDDASDMICSCPNGTKFDISSEECVKVQCENCTVPVVAAAAAAVAATQSVTAPVAVATTVATASTTIKVKVPGEATNGTFDLCNDENAVEDEDGCRCADGYVKSMSGAACLLVATDALSTCTEDVQCAEMNATCVVGLCVSSKVTNVAPLPVPGVVAAAAAAAAAGIVISSPCGSDVNCSAIPHTVCKESVCQCTDGYVTSASGEECLPFATKIGDACRVDKQCGKLNGAACIDGKCAKVHAAAMKASTTGGGATLVAPICHVLALVTAAALI